LFGFSGGAFDKQTKVFCLFFSKKKYLLSDVAVAADIPAIAHT
jgi:hypothetical protein